MRIKLGVPLRLSEIAGCFKLPCASDEQIYYISTDTREANSKDLFFALSGKNDSGEKYVDNELCKKMFVVTTKPLESALTVNDTREALLTLSRYYMSRLKNLKYTVAITGSVGKTTTKEFTKMIVSKKYVTHSTKGNFNNEIGVPLTILSAPENTEVIIAEVGMNHFGEISRISKVLNPDISLITNIGTAHIGNLGSRENIARAKLEILDGMKNGTLIVPKDEMLLFPLGDKAFSTSDISADYCVTADSIYENGAPVAKHGFSLVGAHFLICLSAAVAISLCISVEKKLLLSGISDISWENTRQNIKKVGCFYIFEDYYNASLESVEADFKLILSHTNFAKKSALIGDILELGEHRESIHREIGRLAMHYGLDKLYLFGEYCTYISEGAISAGFDKSKIFINNNKSNLELTKKQILDNTDSDEIILFKASRGMHLEKIVDALTHN